MKPFIVGDLIQFPDYPALRLLLPKIDTHGRAVTPNYFAHEITDHPLMRDFTARFDVKPFVSFLSRFNGGEELTLHADDRSMVKLHFPIETDDCSVHFHSSAVPPSTILATHLYRREEPVLLDVRVPHSLVNRSKSPKYSLILAWDSLDLQSAARMLRSRPSSARP
jgi:hypothetical protein